MTTIFKNKHEFSEYVELRSIREKMPHADIIVDYCEKNEIDPYTIASLINANLKEKLAVYYEKLNCIEKESTSSLDKVL